MEKKVGVFLMGIFIALVVGFNLYSYFSKDSTNSMSGMAINGNAVSQINISLIAFVLQWVVLLAIVMFAYMKFLKHRKEEEEKVENFIIPSLKSKAETNIDIFYALLLEKKSLTSGTIAKVFKITKDQALEWAKILEEHGLASIEYPAFSDPEIRIQKESEEEEEEEIVQENSSTKQKETKE
jgi:hypothetical protein